MATYAAELLKKAFQSNVVILLGGVYYTKRRPDSGLAASPGDGMVQSLKLNPAIIDARDARTSTRNYEFAIVDIGRALTAKFAGKTNAFTTEAVRIWLGRSSVGMDFSQYYELPQTQVVSVGFRNETYVFKSQDASSLLKQPAFDLSFTLASDVDDSGLTLTAAEDISMFPASGTLKVEQEVVTYTAKDDTARTFALSVRGSLSSEAKAHNKGQTVFNMRRLTGNPLTLFLQMLISPGGGGTYDVLTEGLGISQSLIDVAGIVALRDDNFASETFDFWLYDIPDFLEWAQNEIFLACNCRLVTSAAVPGTSAGKLTLAILDSNAFGKAKATLDNASILPETVDFQITSQKIINQVSIAYDYNEATGLFESVYVAEDATSIGIYNQDKDRKPYEIKLKGVKTASGGLDIVVARSKKILARFGRATPEINLTTHFDKSTVQPGDVVRLTYPLPAPDGTRNFSADVEAMQVGLDQETGKAVFALEYTAYTGIKAGYISPADMIASVLAQSKITVLAGRGKFYKAGWFMRLFVPATGETADAANKITDVTGDTLTFATNFSTGLTLSHGVRFANYTEVAADQKDYAFVSAGSANFADGKTPYLVTF